MQRAIPMHGGLFVCPHQAAVFAHIDPSCVLEWAKRQMTSYNYLLRRVKNGGHHFINEADVRVIERVQRDYPLKRGGPGPRRRRKAMEEYATRLRAETKPPV